MTVVTAPAPDMHAPPSTDAIKIWFRFVRRPGWLPYDTEGLWATPVDAATARICNTPFLQNGVAMGDVVRFETDPDGQRWGRERVVASGHCTIRILPARGGPLGGDPFAVRAKLAPFGLGGEVFSDDLPLVAVDIPPDADLPAIKALLIEGREAGWWHVEEGSTTSRWRDA